MPILLVFVDTFDNKLVKRFLDIVKLTTSKEVADLHEIITKHLEPKNFDSLCISFLSFWCNC